MGIARTTLDAYINEKTSITWEILEKISKYLNVEMDYWTNDNKTYAGIIQPLNKIEEPTVKLKQNVADYGKTECPNCNHLLKQIDLQQEIIDCLKRELGYKKERKCS